MALSRSRLDFYRLVKSEGLVARTSKAVMVEGGLTPPPSKIYPGTKCYMVTVSVDDSDYHGFGPTPSIAKYAALQYACEGLHLARSAAQLDLKEDCAMQEEEEDGTASEEDGTASEADTTAPNSDDTILQHDIDHKVISCGNNSQEELTEVFGHQESYNNLFPTQPNASLPLCSHPSPMCDSYSSPLGLDSTFYHVPRSPLPHAIPRVLHPPSLQSSRHVSKLPQPGLTLPHVAHLSPTPHVLHPPAPQVPRPPTSRVLNPPPSRMIHSLSTFHPPFPHVPYSSPVNSMSRVLSFSESYLPSPMPHTPFYMYLPSVTRPLLPRVACRLSSCDQFSRQYPLPPHQPHPHLLSRMPAPFPPLIPVSDPSPGVTPRLRPSDKMVPLYYEKLPPFLNSIPPVAPSMFCPLAQSRYPLQEAGDQNSPSHSINSEADLCSISPFDYSSAPDPLQFTVRLPKAVQLKTSSKKPLWKDYGIVYPHQTRGRALSGNGDIVGGGTELDLGIARVLENYADEEEIEPVSCHSDNDQSKSDVSFADTSRSNGKQVKLNTLDHSTADQTALPAHFLLQFDIPDQNHHNANADNGKKCHNLTATVVGKTTTYHSPEVIKVKKQRWHPLFMADNQPKLCVGMPSEGPIP